MKIEPSNILVVIGGALIGFGVVSWVMRPAPAPMPDVEPAQSRVEAPAQNNGGYGGEIVLMADRGGHYWLDAEVDRASINFMIDTGATMTVLSYDDAKRVGIKVRRIKYDQRVMTGAGEVKFGSVVLSYVQTQSVRVDNLKAWVAPEGTLAKSVLGMNFLKRLDSYSVQSNKMTLVP